VCKCYCYVCVCVCVCVFVCVCVCVCVGCPILSGEPTPRNCVFHETLTICLYWPSEIDRSRIYFAWERIITMWEEVFRGVLSLGPHLAVLVVRALPLEFAKGITLFTSSDDIGTRPSTYHLVKLPCCCYLLGWTLQVPAIIDEDLKCVPFQNV
jgi:hypothetical protein